MGDVSPFNLNLRNKHSFLSLCLLFGLRFHFSISTMRPCQYVFHSFSLLTHFKDFYSILKSKLGIFSGKFDTTTVNNISHSYSCLGEVPTAFKANWTKMDTSSWPLTKSMQRMKIIHHPLTGEPQRNSCINTRNESIIWNCKWPVKYSIYTNVWNPTGINFQLQMELNQFSAIQSMHARL